MPMTTFMSCSIRRTVMFCSSRSLATKVVGTLARLLLLLLEARRTEDRAEHATLDAAVPGNEDVLERSHVVEEADVLKGPRHAERRDFVRRQTGDRPAVEVDAARGRLVHAGEDVEEGRLAGAVRPDEADDLSARDDEVDVVDGDQPSELLPDVDRLEDVPVLSHQRATS